MLFFKDTVSLLSEAAAIDIKMNTESKTEYDAVMKDLDNIEECFYNNRNTARSVVVFETDEGYFTETNHLIGFMKDNNIKSIVEALDLVCEANDLPSKSIGILIDESDFTSMLESADKKAAKANNPKIKKAAVAKAANAIRVAKDLEKQGIKVRKKARICPNCGESRANCKCVPKKGSKEECGGSCGSSVPAGKTVINEEE